MEAKRLDKHADGGLAPLAKLPLEFRARSEIAEAWRQRFEAARPEVRQAMRALANHGVAYGEILGHGDVAIVAAAARLAGGDR